ncbi:hypothetical protein J6590_002721 [Homalodisca vitripennis]|nr:hypothetical protein J6590_002721 [Homalodisca vitripennis]
MATLAYVRNPSCQEGNLIAAANTRPRRVGRVGQFFPLAGDETKAKTLEEQAVRSTAQRAGIVDRINVLVSIISVKLPEKPMNAGVVQRKAKKVPNDRVAEVSLMPYHRSSCKCQLSITAARRRRYHRSIPLAGNGVAADRDVPHASI